MEDTIINSVVPATICELESESMVKDEPKIDVEAEPDTGGGCFDVLDMVEEPFDEAPTNYSSSDEDGIKMYSNCDSSSETGSPDQSLEAAVAKYAADNQSSEADDDVDMEEVFETIDADSNDYDEFYVAERPPSPVDNPIPRGWKQVFHESGATIFVHIETNVCSLSRPYFLGSNSTKQHKLPTTPVPCLRYRSYLQNRHKNVAEDAAFGSTTCEENVAPSAGGVVSDTNASSCPASSSTSIISVPSETIAAISNPNPAISDSNTTISDVNAVTGNENLSTSIENITDSDMNLCPLKNLPNTVNAPPSDADLILFHANVATSNPAMTADPTDIIISDTNLNTCPGHASNHAESAVASGRDTSVLCQDSGTSDVIMVDTSVVNADPKTDTNFNTCPGHAPSHAESAVASGTDASVLRQDSGASDVIMADASVVIADPKNDTNLDTCPGHASSHAESAVAYGTDASALSQDSGTSDVIMADASVANADPETSTSNATILDSNCHPSPVLATTCAKNAGISGTEELSINIVPSDEHSIICDENAVAPSNTFGANAIICDPNAVTSNTHVPTSAPNLPTLVDNPATSYCDTISTASAVSTSSTNDAIASTSSILPTAENPIKVTSPVKNVTASKFNTAVPDHHPYTSSRDAETVSSHNDTIVADSAVAEEAQLLEYCKRLFKFKKIKYLKFRSWDVRRTYLRALRNERNRRRCPFSNNKVLSFPIETKDSEGNVVATKKWIINPRGRSYVAILHEYLQQSKKTQPEYKFTEVDNARNPYAATVVVNGTEYGTGFGMSKKDAKFEAAKATLEVLLPKMMKYVLSVCCNKTGSKKYEDYSDNEDDLQNVASAFDDIEIVDPRVTELSLQTTEPKPYELLLNCLQKKGEQPEVKFEFQAESMESTMAVGENKVTLKCANKREGKQLAAQAMLQQLHPHIKNWGSLLRLYGNSITNQYRQVTDDKDVEELKCRPANKELLDTLRRRMSSLPDRETEDVQVSSEQP